MTTMTLNKPLRRIAWPRGLGSPGVFVLAVTAFAALIRFAFLGRPALWNDEALTFSRACGTYDQMLQVLREDGFGPLHYELYWVLGRHFQMTPFVMRLWPAISGTLMVPAIYLLGFELLGRRVAKTAAVLAATSAFLLAFSRDAKMYMPLWFFITLHTGCLLWWMRTGRWTAWLGFVAAGCAAAGMHFTGLIVVGLDLLIGLTGPNLTWKRSLLLAMGILLIVSGPVGYALKFNQMRERVDRQGWDATQIGWVAGRTNGHDGAALAADEGGALAFCFSWLDEEGVRVQVPRWIMGSAAALLALFTSAMVVGMFSLRCESLCGDFKTDARKFRAVLWLSIWILVPAYGFYRASVPIASDWKDWFGTLGQTLADHHLYIWMIVAMAGAIALTRWWYVRVGMGAAGALLMVWYVAVVVASAMLNDSFSTIVPPNWLWVHPLAPFGAMILLLAVAWSASSRPLRVRWVVPVGILVALGVVLALCQAIDVSWLEMELHPVWLPRYLGFMCPAVIVVVAALLLRLPVAFLRWGVLGLLVAVNLVMAGAHVFAGNEPPLDKMAADAIEGMKPGAIVFAVTPSIGPGGGPHGSGTILDPSGAYYLYIFSQKPVTPEQFRESAVTEYFPLQLEFDPSSISSADSNQSQIHRLIVWDRIETGDAVSKEDILPRLGGRWREESQELYPVRCFWDWGPFYTARRREYVR